MLTVPAPTLVHESLAPGLAPRELPLVVGTGPITQDAVPIGPELLVSARVLTFRRIAPAAPLEAWDSTTTAWVAEGTAGPSTDVMFFVPDAPLPWQCLVVPAGEPRFGTAVAGYPQYSFRVLVVAGAEAAASAETPPVAFGSVLDRNRMVIGPGEGEEPETATEARLLLKDAALSVIGGLVVHRDGSSARVTVSCSAGASVVLLPDGGIELRPAAGRGVLVAGDLETERLVYRPGGGGPKKTAV